jgi:membrane protein YdbS with pleckstrin-like domain
MTQIFARRLLAALLATVVVIVVFVLAYLILLAVVRFSAISYFESVDPNWDAGPGGIILLPVFVIVLPFAIWLTGFASKRIMRLLSKRFELLRAGQLAADIPLLFLTVGLLGIGIPFIKGLVSG